jgi:hypothetical protein
MLCAPHSGGSGCAPDAAAAAAWVASRAVTADPAASATSWSPPAGKGGERGNEGIGEGRTLSPKP